MIFVTVGTHEQGFDRLIKKIDELVAEGLIKDEVFMQTGFTSYETMHCQFKKLISYQEMQERLAESDVVITHGGPSSYMPVLQLGKCPIVVPRREKFHEHVNDHQLDFSHKVLEQGYKIELVETEDLNDLLEVIERVKAEQLNTKKSQAFASHHEVFMKSFKKEVEKLMKGKV